jgi:methyl-accepting chemotaxis protein
VESISTGSIPPKIAAPFPGDFNTLKNNLNQCIEAVNMLAADAKMLSQAAVAGNLAARADASKHQGDFHKIINGVNETLDALIGPLNMAAACVDSISKGKIPPPIADSFPGDFNTIKENLNNLINVVNLLISDANTLAKSAVAGKLATRADTSLHRGDFRKIVQGVNDTFDAVIGPLNIARQYLDRIAHGDIPQPISESWPGDFAGLRDNINTCIETMGALLGDASRLAEAATAGCLSERADLSQHSGEFQRIVDGMNRTLEGVVHPLRDIDSFLQRLSRSDFTVTIDDHYPGEYHQLCEAANTAAQHVRAAISDIRTNISTLASAAEVLDRTSREMSIDAEQTSAQAQVVSSVAKQVSESVQTVAYSTQELSASIHEIASSANEAAKVAADAVEAAQTTTSSIAKLGDSSTKIGEVVKTITSIAQQTNLLALNATIEAARAGESGKGFAVVANEVKELSRETARATEDISSRIETIQTDTKAAIKVITQVSSIIWRIHELQTTIASAVEQQGATSSSIKKNVNEAAVGAGDIAKHITGVAQAAAKTATRVEGIQAAASDLAKMADGLRSVVTRFRV